MITTCYRFYCCFCTKGMSVTITSKTTSLQRSVKVMITEIPTMINSKFRSLHRQS